MEMHDQQYIHVYIKQLLVLRFRFLMFSFLSFGLVSTIYFVPTCFM